MGIVIAIIGRPNVGKSTLFNRLVGRKIALVDDTPGVTRDRRIHDGRLYDLRFSVIDTAGLEEADSASLAGRMRAQTQKAVEDADIILFVVDAKNGLTPVDEKFANLIRKSGKPMILVANKAESAGADLSDAWKLGFGEPCQISAEHGLGMANLRDALVELAGIVAFSDKEFGKDDGQRQTINGDDVIDPDDEGPEYDATKPLRIAVCGRPNAGKSTLINAMLDDDRLLTSPQAGTTRDAISVDWLWHGRQIKIYDTAGLRRKARITEKIEKLSVGETLRAIRFAEVVIIVFDATMPFEKQDIQIVDLVIREGRAPIIAFNKWDLIENRQETLTYLHEKCMQLLPQVKGIRAVPVSGEFASGIDLLMQNVEFVHRIWNKRISTGKLNRWLATTVSHHPPPAVAGRRLKVKYMTQIKVRPPAFVISCSRPEAMPQAYLRYLTNGLRVSFDMPAVPIRLLVRGSDNPFEGRAKKKK